MSVLTTPSQPPFPEDVPTAKLSKISLAKLMKSDETESAAFFKACCTNGFLLMELTESVEGKALQNLAEQVYDLGKEVFEMPPEESQKYALRPGTAFGYKGVGLSKVDLKGTPDRCEFWGLSKDELLGQSANPSPMPPLITRNNELLGEFAKHSHNICLQLLFHLENHLGLERGNLASLHRLETTSSDQVRLLKMSPQPADDKRTSLLPHTDFGSITLLWNMLGGLQILPPEAGNVDSNGTSDGWQYVRPEPGCVVVNMGDSLVEFSNRVVRSNLHRVTWAPGIQAQHMRYSMAYFMRPEDDVLMKPFGMQDASPENNGDENKIKPQYYTSKEWVGIKSDAFRAASGPMQSSGGKLTSKAGLWHSSGGN